MTHSNFSIESSDSHSSKGKANARNTNLSQNDKENASLISMWDENAASKCLIKKSKKTYKGKKRTSEFVRVAVPSKIPSICSSFEAENQIVLPMSPFTRELAPAPEPVIRPGNYFYGHYVQPERMGVHSVFRQEFKQTENRVCAMTPKVIFYELKKLICRVQ